MLKPTDYQSSAGEVLVIGGGAAALSAAIAARRTGAKVRLLEQAEPGLRGGNTRHSRNARFMHEAPSPLAAGPYPAAELAADLHRATAASTAPALAAPLAAQLIQASEALPDWLQSVGVALQPAGDGRLPVSRKTLFFLGGGKALLNALYQCAEAEGVRIQYRQEVLGVQLDGTRVGTVAVRSAEGTTSLRPGAVIACCGAAQANRRWLRAQLGAAADGLINRGTPNAQGAVMLSLLEQGTLAVGDPRRLYLVAVDARSPADDGGIVTRVRGMPAGIVVDADARRVHDEGAETGSTRYSAWGQRLAEQPGQIGWLLLDAEGEQMAPAGIYPPVRAASPEALAAQLGLDPNRLAATIAGYNAATRSPAAGGETAGAETAGWHTVGLSPPKSAHARPLCTPPFAAYPMRPGITFSQYGLAVDPQLRVLLQDQRPIENLFAAGMIMAANLIGTGYLSGLALTIGLVFGRLAGERAAQTVNSGA
ncbi:FAD-dependent tricarballylate dehydrogenase TcuA [Halochromatium glycolicum]|uniref:FAD-dependent tricarballylate dehydrogenase TcuA n=1 Tax=Halochromatium glycolicum TaxID=85075 RepID=UPI001F5B2C72|nr:FAD-dependent tricarballylate dehydrogenase TcuA [Halochromatium glycolicum]